MKWSEVNHTHDGLYATVTPPPEYPQTAKDRIYGKIKCEDHDKAIAMLKVGENRTHMFAAWYNVELS